jgi:hypothetical protein
MKAKQKIKLDFSGGPNSWFDLWHTHVDWDREGSKHWEKRKKFLLELIVLYGQYKAELKRYPGNYQLWISIDDIDSGQDAVYIHTKNPNADNFPIKVPGDKDIKTKSKELKYFLETIDFEIIRYETEDGDIYYLFEKGTGEKLE